MFNGRPLAGVHGQQVPAAGTEYSIWGTGTLGTSESGPEQPVIVGTKFRASSNGYIVGIRWQNVTGRSPAGDVALWQSTTNVSGTRTVTGQTSDGWQRMNFASPVAITANTIYTAAVRHTSAVNAPPYRSTGSYFASAGYTNGPLEAVANSVSVNGVYRYSATMAVPDQTWYSTSYFIDVIYTQ